MITDQQVVEFHDHMARRRSGSHIVAVRYRAFKGVWFDPLELSRVIKRGQELGLWEVTPVPGTIRLIKANGAL